jgi:GAF domain-containing protein
MLGAPILLEEELIGVVVVVRKVQGPFSDDEMALLKTFSDQAAIAIANARLLEAVERQRTELARFLSPQVAELITSSDGRTAPGRSPGISDNRLLRSARLHSIRGNS